MVLKNRISRYLSSNTPREQDRPPAIPTGFILAQLPQGMGSTVHQPNQQNIYQLAYHQALQDIQGHPDTWWYDI